MSEADESKFPFILTGDFKKACRGCPALDVKAEVMRGQDKAGEEAVYLILECYNAEVCRAIENRPLKEMPLHVGDSIWFMNGQTGVIKELVLGTSDMEPLLRCLKYIDGEPYDAEYPASEIGSSIFLSVSARAEYLKSSKGVNGDEKHADGSQ